MALWSAHLPDIPKDDMSPAAVDLNQDRRARIEADLREKARREAPARMNGAVRENSRKTALNFPEMGPDPVSVSKGAGLPLEELPAPAGKPQ